MTVSTVFLIASLLTSLASLILHALTPVPAALQIHYTPSGATPLNPPDFQADETVTASVVVLDKKGRPMTPPTPPTWTSSDPSRASVLADGPGVNATITGVAPGRPNLVVTCGAATDSAPLNVTPALPASLSVTFGTPG